MTTAKGDGNGYRAGEQAGSARARLELLERDVADVKAKVHTIDERERNMELTLTRIEAGMVGRDKLESDRRQLSARIGRLETWATRVKANVAVIAVIVSALWSVALAFLTSWFRGK